MPYRIKNGEVWFYHEKKWWRESAFAVFFPEKYVTLNLFRQ